MVFIFIIIIVLIAIKTNANQNGKNSNTKNVNKYDRDIVTHTSAVNQALQQSATRAEAYLKAHPQAVSNTASNRIVKSAKNKTAEKNEEHDHAYVHKVEPIDTISVVDSEETTIAHLRNKREENDRKQQLEEIKSRYADRNAAKNGDRIDVVSSNEQVKICSYCGAKNIVPKYSSTKYTCYFCREEI